jgi:hypothetical protein
MALALTQLQTLKGHAWKCTLRTVKIRHQNGPAALKLVRLEMSEASKLLQHVGYTEQPQQT